MPLNLLNIPSDSPLQPHLERLKQFAINHQLQASVLTAFYQVALTSSFVWQQWQRSPSLIVADLTRTMGFDDFISQLEKQYQSTPPSISNLHQWHQDVLRYLACQIILEPTHNEQQLTDLTRLAETIMHYTWRHVSDNPPPFCVFALGKLGAGELNFSSDIDLVIVADGEDMQTTRLVQQWVGLLTQPLPGAMFYRVDLRLRPFGESGPLVCSETFLMQYLESHGRDWERLAWMRARPIFRVDDGRKILESIRSFIYRKYLDFNAIDEIRTLKQKMMQSKARHPLHVKLGPGGIRDIEFIMQSFQLIYGGVHPQLRGEKPLTILANAKFHEILGAKKAQALQSSYLFLRRLENHLQLAANRQTHEMPHAPVDQARLGVGMDQSYDAIIRTMQKAMQDVEHIFKSLLPAPPSQASIKYDDWPASWQQITQTERFEKRTIQQKKVLHAFLQSAFESELPEKSVMALVQLLIRKPVYIGFIAQLRHASQIFDVINHAYLLEAVIACPLLIESLLQEVTIPRDGLSFLATEIQGHADDELWLESLVLAKQKTWFQWARLFLQEKISARDVSGVLSEATDAIIHAVMQRALKKHALLQDNFLVVGMGRLGDRSMGFASDLDLIFLHQCHENNHTELLPLVRLINTYLTTTTRFGKLFDMDTRLRPSGQAGALVTSLDYFRRYQMAEAQTWEHQALVKARSVWGAPAIQHSFEQVHQEIMGMARDAQKITKDVQQMLEKIQSHKGHSNPVKYGKDGLVALEFASQREQLLASSPVIDAYPEALLAHWGLEAESQTWAAHHQQYIKHALNKK